MTRLDAKTSFTAAWSAASFEDDLRRWSAFLAAHDLTWSPDAGTHDLVARLARAGTPSAADAIAMRLAKLADDAFTAKGDPRRIVKLEATGARYALAPDERRALEAEGHRFVAGHTHPLRALATIPITLGAYYGANYVCTRAGLDRNIAFVVALVVYAVTVRLVRGRWPLQPS
jgi:hypothetical protein